MDGILLVDKPAGISSFGAVARIRWIIKEKTGQKVKVGHTGTLDPVATGLLILVIGSYTKKAGEFSKLDKTYEAELTLGKVSTTGDSEGVITGYSSKKPSLAQIEQVLSRFTGKIQQTPHIYSAIKVGGKRAYKMARAGEEVQLQRREVKIYDLQIKKYDYPILKIEVRVSSGTYIRSLAEDIGQTLGTGAYLSSLRRTKVGTFDIKDSIKLGKINPDMLAGVIRNGTVK
ncbi:MAG TPA: tRNA pseudouridine(55) synthase TruB [Candidatus Saccharimonadales bacterium]|nr:tRNA pseudouridine(55) synthase TruB [Candidatus Saccharimonadales bacterium]